MHKLCVDLSQLGPAQTDRAIDALLSYLQNEPAEIRLEIARHPGRLIRIPPDTLLPTDRILYVCASGHYCLFTMQAGVRKVRFRFDDVRRLLPQEEFLDCNRGVLLHMPEISCREGNGFRMKDGTLFPIRSRHKKEIIQQYEHYLLLHA